MCPFYGALHRQQKNKNISQPYVILNGFSLLSAGMRRFIVIFLLFILPIQVLAESLNDLPTVPYSASTTEATDSAYSDYSSVLNSTTFFLDKPYSQQAVHADISDSVRSAELYVYNPHLFEQWFDYSFSSHPLAYPPLRRPPRV